MRSWLALGAFLLLAVGACTARDTPADEENGGEKSSSPMTTAGPLDFEVLAEGNYGRIARGEVSEAPEMSDPFLEVATSAGELEHLWSRYVSDEPVPAVDLEEKIVVFLLVPLRPTGGYGVGPVAVDYRGGSIVVEADYREPGKGMMTTQALTAPYAVISVERPVGWSRVEWVDGDEVLGRSEARDR